MYFRWIACLCLHFIDLIREGYSTRLNWAETIKVGPRGQWWGPWCWWWGGGGWGWRRQWWFGRRWWWWQRYSTQLGRNYQGRSSAFHPAPNQTHCSPNANVLFGRNTDTDGHADMYQYTGKVGFSNIFIGPRFSSNQLVRRSVCRSRHHQQHYNTVEANRAMQCNSMQVDYRVIMVTIKVIMVIIIIRMTMGMMMIMMETWKGGEWDPGQWGDG